MPTRDDMFEVLRQVDPKYTSEAMRLKIQVTVGIEVVVGTDGIVDRARIVQSLDPVDARDANALDADKHFTFERGTLNGQPVTVLCEVTTVFRLGHAYQQATGFHLKHPELSTTPTEPVLQRPQQ